MEQQNLFETPVFKIDKPIRLIELFAGIGAQAKALQNIGADFERYRVVEIEPLVIKTYNAVHGTDFVPLDITKISGDDLGVRERERFCYIMTYSFPCQDLSVAGNQKGMEKGAGTRSGLLWEVERLLNELGDNLPQVLLMENVPQVHGTKNMPDFIKWIHYLSKKGYSSFYKDLSATDFGIPQSRTRCFMVSILGDWEYHFPEPQPLKTKLSDLLEEDVPENFFVNSKDADLLLEKLRNES